MKFLEILQPFSEAATRGVAQKKLFLNILWYSQENTGVGVSFLIKRQAVSPATLLKKDSNTDIYLWISANLLNTYFYKFIITFANDSISRKWFVRTFFRSELSKGNFWWNKNGHLLCERLLKLINIEQKCFLS